MEDVVKVSIDFLYDNNEDSTCPEYTYESINVLEKYISYIEQLLLNCSDCPSGYNLEDLREDFKEDCLDD